MLSMEKYFDGYSVPASLQETVTAVCNRFAINGLCDAMYISNVIANDNGFGDGCGNFTEPQKIDGTKTAKFLQGAYGCNIMRDELGELAAILETGKLDAEKSERGIIAFMQRNEDHKKTCAPWYVRHLDRENIFLSRVLESLRGELAHI